jgi:hypothetical protein
MSNGDHKMSCKTPSLRTNIPAIPTAFVEAYIKAYNEGNTITEVALEYEENYHSNNDAYCIIKKRPDNTVIVHPVRLFTRYEMQLCWEVATRNSGLPLPTTFNEWIKHIQD